MKPNFFIIFLLALITACSNTPRTQKDNGFNSKNDVARSDATAQVLKSDKSIYLLPIVITDADLLTKVKEECDILSVFKNTMIDTASKHQLSITYLEEENEQSKQGVQVKVEYIDVIPHRWRIMSIRPSSTATFRVSLFKGGEHTGTAVKTINSGMAMGACGRLEKISVAGARFVNTWVSRRL